MKDLGDNHTIIIEVERLTRERDTAREEADKQATQLRELGVALECYDETARDLTRARVELAAVRSKLDRYNMLVGELVHVRAELEAVQGTLDSVSGRAVELDEALAAANARIAELEALDRDPKKLRRRLAEAKAEIAELHRTRTHVARPEVTIIEAPVLATIAAARARSRRRS